MLVHFGRLSYQGRHWYSLADAGRYTLADYEWYSLADAAWYIIVRLLTSGARLTEIAALLGHSDLPTLQRHLDLQDAEDRNAAAG